MSLAILPVLLLSFAGGLALGLLYLALLRTSVRLILKDRRAGLGAGLTVARLVLVGGGLWVAVQFGAAALLGAFAGFIAIRIVGTRKPGPRPWT